jgi:hypothetical protein
MAVSSHPLAHGRCYEAIHDNVCTLLESVGVNNVLGVAINTGGKRHLVADVAKTSTNVWKYEQRLWCCFFVGTAPHGNSSGTLQELFGNSSGSL